MEMECLYFVLPAAINCGLDDMVYHELKHDFIDV